MMKTGISEEKGEENSAKINKQPMKSFEVLFTTTCWQNVLLVSQMLVILLK
jgi:hypothetical protein